MAAERSSSSSSSRPPSRGRSGTGRPGAGGKGGGTRSGTSRSGSGGKGTSARSSGSSTSGRTGAGGGRTGGPHKGPPRSSSGGPGRKPSTRDSSSRKAPTRKPSDRRGSARDDQREGPEMAGPKQWGRLARKGAGTMRPRADGQDRGAPKDYRRDAAPPDRDDGRWVRVDDVRDEARRAVGRGRPELVARETEIDRSTTEGELQTALGPARAPKAQKRLKDAARSFDRGYDEEARRILRPLAKEAPGASAVRELYGLALYRLGRWPDAVVELEAFRQLTGSTEQNPVLADAYRAMGDHDRVVPLWDELRSASPSSALVTEGRIVMAGSLADQGRLADAVRVLSERWRMPKRPQEHHLRRAYALADLYVRAGDVPRARELFRRLQAADPRFGDVGKRVRALG